jgi:glucose-6-phosphate dehydrogenase assembly protein OpcA
MASAVADRAWRRSTPERIEPDLAALWRDLAQADQPIARAVMSNLVVVCHPTDDAGAGVEGITAALGLDEVAARHPSRLIVLEHEPGRPNPDAPFAAGVGIITFGSPQARYGVELIVVRSACAEASLPSIVRRFVRGDLPTTVWWTGDLSQVPPLDALVTMGRQLLYDSRLWRDVRRGVSALAPLVAGRQVDLADLNWRRLGPMRQALDHAAGAAGSRSRHDVTVRIVHRRGEAALAWLLAASLLATRDQAAGPAPEIEESQDDDAVLSVVIRHGTGETTATLTSRGVVVADGSTAPFVVGVPIESEGDAVAAELRTLSHDTRLDDAINALARWFAAA